MSRLRSGKSTLRTVPRAECPTSSPSLLDDDDSIVVTFWPAPRVNLDDSQHLKPEVIREAAIANGVCVRPIMQRLVDTVTGRIYDIPWEQVSSLCQELGEAFRIIDYQITFYGEYRPPLQP